MASWLVGAVAAFFCVMGLVALAKPDQVLAVFGTPRLTRDGRNEVRAVYGGFGIAIGSLLLIALQLPGLRTGTTVAVAVALLGMALGRIIGAVIDGSPGFFPWLFFGVELVLALLLIISLQLVG